MENNQGPSSSDRQEIKLYNGYKCKKESTKTGSTMISVIRNRCRIEYKTSED